MDFTSFKLARILRAIAPLAKAQIVWPLYAT
jgi:hypothetical protein